MAGWDDMIGMDLYPESSTPRRWGRVATTWSHRKVPGGIPLASMKAVFSRSLSSRTAPTMAPKSRGKSSCSVALLPSSWANVAI